MIEADHVLPLIFAALTAGAVLAYVLMDGWDLGVGILLPLVARRTDAITLFDSIAPFWDANETWLVFGGTMLLSGFPLAYSTLLPHIYVPLILMLVNLALRGVSYEFQAQGGALQRLWQWLFALGSIAVALCQGWILGLTVEGFAPTAHFRGILYLLARQLFPSLCSVGLVGGYALLGCCWLILKTQGAVQILGREVGQVALLVTGVLLIVISIWTPLTTAYVAQRWFVADHRAALWLLPAAAMLFAWRLKRSLWGSRDARPLLWAILLFVVAYAGIIVSIYPFIVPYRYTVFDAANDTRSLRFEAIGVSIVLPVTILYLSLAYRVFRGKLPQSTDGDLATIPHIGARHTSVQCADLHLS